MTRIYAREQGGNVSKKILIAVTVIFLIINFFYLIHKGKKQGISEVIGEDHRLPETTYRPPIVKIPFVPDKQPMPTSRLPIPKSDVDKTIVITTDAEVPRNIEIIISKSGDVYFPTDAPKGISARVTTWKPRWIHAGLSLGVSAVTDFKVNYVCLSINYLYIGKLTMGADAGIAGDNSKALLGLAMRYPLFTISASDAISVNISIGYNLIGKSLYGGVHLKW